MSRAVALRQGDRPAARICSLIDNRQGVNP